MMAQSFLESETAAVEVIPQVRAIQGEHRHPCRCCRVCKLLQKAPHCLRL